MACCAAGQSEANPPELTAALVELRAATEEHEAEAVQMYTLPSAQAREFADVRAHAPASPKTTPPPA